VGSRKGYKNALHPDYGRTFFLFARRMEKKIDLIVDEDI
jgi:hypothetical protein